MAVPGRRNGINDDEEELDDNALFEEQGVVEDDTDTPPHLRDLSAAAQIGDAHALRLALGLSLSLSSIYCNNGSLTCPCYTLP